MGDARAIAALGVGASPRVLATLGFGAARSQRFDQAKDRRVALQGAGFSTRTLALQGFGAMPAAPGDAAIGASPSRSVRGWIRTRRSRRDELLLVKP